jgi:hypothetical protein
MKRLELFLKSRVTICRDLKENERFFPRLNLSLPAINRFNLRRDIRARHEVFRDELLRDSARGFRVRKRAEGNQDFFRHSLGKGESGLPADPAAAEDHIAFVKNGRLSGRDRFLRLMQPQAGPSSL